MLSRSQSARRSSRIKKVQFVDDDTVNAASHGQIQSPPELRFDKVTGRLLGFTLIWTIPDMLQFRQRFRPIRSPWVGGLDWEVSDDARFSLILREQPTPRDQPQYFSLCIDAPSWQMGMEQPSSWNLSGKCRVPTSHGRALRWQTIQPMSQSSDYWGVEQFVLCEKVFSKYSHMLTIEMEVTIPESPLSRHIILPPAELIRLRRDKPDFTVRSSDQREFRVRYANLESASRYFTQLTKKPQRLFVFPSVHSDLLSILVEYLRGDISVIPEQLEKRIIANALELVPICEQFGFDLVLQVCREHLQTVLPSVSSAADLLIYFHQTDSLPRILDVSAFIRAHLAAVADHGGTVKLMNYNMQFFNNYVLRAPLPGGAGPGSMV